MIRWYGRLSVAALTAWLVMGGWLWSGAALASSSEQQAWLKVGTARVDITPAMPIRLGGYASREEEATDVEQRLYARAVAFGSDEQGPAVLIVADALGVTASMSDAVAERLKARAGLGREQVMIMATHTHSAPIVVGDRERRHPLTDAQRQRFDAYSRTLAGRLYEAATAALADREPARVSRGVGQVRFAVNRRVIEDGRWTGFGETPDGPVDHDLPVMRVKEADGSLRAVLVNYACHATTDSPRTNTLHGDWPGAAAQMLERQHAGATAIVTIGCAGDANPKDRSDPAMIEPHASSLVAEVNRLLDEPLKPLTAAPRGRFEILDLPLEQPAEAGETVPYGVGVWRFGDQLAMVHLAGEVTSGYALRLKRELAGPLWINTYANGYPGYIVTAREHAEGGYEPDNFRHRHGARHAVQVEDLLIGTVSRMAGPDFAEPEDN